MSKQYDGSKLEQSTDVEKTWKLGIKGFSKMILLIKLLRMRNVLKNGLEWEMF